MEDLFKRLPHLAGTVSRCSSNVQLSCVVFVEAVDELGPSDSAHLDQRTKRYLAPIRTAYIKLVNVCDIRSRRAFGLNVSLPLAPEAIELVDEITSHEGLHGGVNVRQIHLLLQSFFFVHIGIELRNSRLIRRNRSGNLRTL